MSHAKKVGLTFFTSLAAIGGFFAATLWDGAGSLNLQTLKVESRCARNVAVQMKLDGMDSAPEFHFKGPRNFKWQFSLPGKNISYGLYIDGRLVDNKEKAVEIPARHTIRIQLDKSCNYKGEIT